MRVVVEWRGERGIGVGEDVRVPKKQEKTELKMNTR